MDIKFLFVNQFSIFFSLYFRMKRPAGDVTRVSVVPRIKKGKNSYLKCPLSLESEIKHIKF